MAIRANKNLGKITNSINFRRVHCQARSSAMSGLAVAVVCILTTTSAVSAGGRKAGPPPPIVPQPRFGDPLQGLTVSQTQAFLIGSAKYGRPLLPAEGLGPLFNKNNCGNCHNNPKGGPGTQMVTRFGRIVAGVFDPLEEFGGSLLQNTSVGDCQEQIPVEAEIIIFRVTNGAQAYGLVEAIPDAAIAANETSPPAPGISGRVHWVEALEAPPMSPLRAGRFGWKAQVPTVHTFSLDASLNEMGLTSSILMIENDPNGINPPDLGSPDFCDTVADPEDSIALGNGIDKTFTQVITDFQRFLAPPPQTPRSGMSGEAIFNSIGCNACHVKTFTTSNDPGLEDVIRNKVIHPYSDWLLHDMGPLGDQIVQGDAEGLEMKTPPLWGVRRRDPMLHDGRAGAGTFASRIDTCMFWHNQVGSEAQASGYAYTLLSASDKAKVVAFLDSLGKAEFDMDGNEFIDMSDFILLHGCYGPGPYNADSPCAVSDINQDGDVDLSDFDSFMMVYNGPMRDCNLNGIVDLRDILTGVGTDANNNGILDGCEPTCDTDTNGTHGTDIDDLVAVITQWGACSPSPLPCRGDVNYNRVVNIDDLVFVITLWGPCP